MDFGSLSWTHTGMMLRLQGAQVTDLLGPMVCPMRGRHRPLWHPDPGMDDVRVLVIHSNPRRLSPSEVFQLATHLGF